MSMLLAKRQITQKPEPEEDRFGGQDESAEPGADRSSKEVPAP